MAFVFRPSLGIKSFKMFYLDLTFFNKFKFGLIKLLWAQKCSQDSNHIEIITESLKIQHFCGSSTAYLVCTFVSITKVPVKDPTLQLHSPGDRDIQRWYSSPEFSCSQNLSAWWLLTYVPSPYSWPICWPDLEDLSSGAWIWRKTIRKLSILSNQKNNFRPLCF